MKVRMVRMFQTSADGIHVDLYKAGQTYVLPDILARSLVTSGIAIEDKDMEAAPEMKEAPQPQKHKRRKG